MIISKIPSYPEFIELPSVIAHIAIPIVSMLTCWGFATLLLYLPRVLKSVGKSAVKGYEIGDSIKTTHISATHTYGNNYKVSSYTESNGCLFAIFGGVAGFFLWAVFCVYIGPFLNFRKIVLSMKNIAKYRREKSN